MSTAIAIEGVTKRFGIVVAVDGLGLRVPRGSLYGFMLMRLGWPCGWPLLPGRSFARTKLGGLPCISRVVLTTLTALAAGAGPPAKSMPTRRI